jgi:hypothetical protein
MRDVWERSGGVGDGGMEWETGRLTAGGIHF